MVQLKPSGPAWSGEQPKHGHMSEIDPEFALLQTDVDKAFEQLWALPMDDFKAGWLNAPVPLPENPPQPGKDYTVHDQVVKVRDGAEIGIRLYRPLKEESNATLVLKAHGGGWVVGSHEVEEVENRYLAAKGGAVVLSVDYRMAPEYKYPYAINDCFDVLLWAKKNSADLKINPERIILAGGSAGGNISAVLAQKARDENISGVVGQILNIPVTCHPKHFPNDRYAGGSYQQNKDASVVDAPKMDWFWDQYLPDASPEVYASPLLAKDLSGLPPALIQVAGLDPLRDEGIAYAEALKAAGVKVELHTYKGLPHGFYMFPHLKQSEQYWSRSADFVKALSRP